MPSTVVGLALLIALLAPGFCFVAAREAKLPERELSGLRETSLFLVAALLSDALSLLVLALVWLLWPFQTPDVSMLILKPAAYIAAHVGLMGWWSIALIGLSCGIGWIAGKVSLKLPEFPGRRIRYVSAWFEKLEEADQETFCGCALDDGSWVGGYLLWYNTDLRETSDRDLVLTRPLFRRGPMEDHERFVPDVERLFVSARRIVYLTTTYLPRGTGDARLVAERERLLGGRPDPRAQ